MKKNRDSKNNKEKQEEEEDLIEIIIVENVTIDTSLMQHGLRQRVMMT